MPRAAAPCASVDAEPLIDHFLSEYDLAITEHLVVDASTDRTYRAAQTLDFLTVRSPLVSATFALRGVPARLRGHAVAPPPELHLAHDANALPGWLVLGELPGREVAFGAVGKFWKADIEWRDVPVDDFRAFAEPGWGKIACHFLVVPDGPGRSVLTYECRTSTTDLIARRTMARYWWMIRPFAGHIMRAALATIRASAERPE